jgi:hypothetical protein
MVRKSITKEKGKRPVAMMEKEETTLMEKEEPTLMEKEDPTLVEKEDPTAHPAIEPTPSVKTKVPKAKGSKVSKPKVTGTHVMKEVLSKVVISREKPQTVVTPPAKDKMEKEKAPVIKTLKIAPKKRNSYLRTLKNSNINVKVSGPTRMRNFARVFLHKLNNDESVYSHSTSVEQQLYLPISKGITKLTIGANQELQRVTDQIVRSYISRACMLAHINNKACSVTVSNLDTVANYFTAI